MYTSRDRIGSGFHQSGTPCFCPPRRCYSSCRSSSPSPNPSPSALCTNCSHISRCPVPIPHFARKTVRFDQRNPHLGRSRSVSRAGFHGTCTDVASLYRPTSPTLMSRPKSITEDNKVMEYANLNVLLRRLSILQLEMKGLLNGKSLRERVQMIGKNLDDDTHASSLKASPCTENMQPDCVHTKCPLHVSRCDSRVEQAHPMQMPRWETPQVYKRDKQFPKVESIAHQNDQKASSKLPELTQNDTTDEQTLVDDAVVSDADWKEKKQIVQFWRDYNCDLHLRRIIDGSRKEAACRIMEKIVHAQLTFYMLQYIAAVAKGLMGDEKTHYLSFFKREGPFESKPLNEGTYCELLTFVDRQASCPARDVMKALEVSEEGLEEEGGRAGYDPNGIGDIRAQMRVFISVIAPSSINSAMVTSADDDDDDDEAVFKRDFLQDLIKAADHGKLGPLQQAHRLIRLACYLALKRVESFTE